MEVRSHYRMPGRTSVIESNKTELKKRINYPKETPCGLGVRHCGGLAGLQGGVFGCEAVWSLAPVKGQ